MQYCLYYVGVDISSPDFCGSVYQTPDIPVKTITDIENGLSGFKTFEQWLTKHQITSNNCVICLEVTGVYAEQFCYYFTAKGYPVALEPQNDILAENNIFQKFQILIIRISVFGLF
jgi:hypothetical protein